MITNRTNPTDNKSPEQQLFILLNSKGLLFLLFVIEMCMFFFAASISKVPYPDIMYQGIFVVLFTLLVYASFHLLLKKFLDKRKFLKLYASTHGLQFLENIDQKLLTGRLCKRFIDDHQICYFSSKQSSFPLKVFHATYRKKFGKIQIPYYFTIVEITIEDGQFPYTHLHKKSTIKHQESLILGDYKDVEVSLNLHNENYELFTRNNYEIEAMQLCAPDFIELIQSSHLDLSVEFAENHLYIYTQTQLSTEEDLDELYRVTKAVIDTFGNFLLRMRDDYAALDEVYAKN